MISVITTAFISFVSTNVDDLFVLMLFYTQVSSTMKKRHIVIGQYLGIGTLIIISVVCALGITVFPHEYAGLLGLVPIYLGIKMYIDHKKKVNDSDKMIHENYEPGESTDVQKNCLVNFAGNFINPSVVKVAAVTIANGADNIGIYIPVFASMSIADILITVIIFLFLVALWCFVSTRLAEYPFIERNIKKNKYIFVPVVFIGLGIFILIESGTISFIYNSVL